MMRMIYLIGNHQGSTTSRSAQLHSGCRHQKAPLRGNQRTQPQLTFQHFTQPPPCQTSPPKGKAKHQLAEPFLELPLPDQMMKSNRPDLLKDRGDTTSSPLTVTMTAAQQYQ
ncbi:hypothetical protein V6N11_046734 [Hibiscus sabdariffa]|uniref:Uncharacterized protein n=1 Tax=Hibiscus sabdariffa TaxID=183260 RepID=A0ABR2NGF9_9ROSI